jgi:adenosylcobinamide-phosphate synthase|uniref:Probable cobalamin biosynthesis protein CobD n=1 Tax=uncultured marine thaumarchaeote AD1000_20_B03 TaxID=1455899 RepID=A0A075FLB3_9ARCH|nr:cobalamin biosynthesis protein (cbiB, cobD) [uncultured marine thaumarchaeote AD1000_20_B03]
MILESIVIVGFALLLDFLVGDPKTKYHPTAWMGKLIASLVPFTKSNSARKELLGGILLVSVIVIVVSTLLVVLDIGISLLTIDIISLVVSIAIGSILLKTTIAIKGMQKHALAVVNAVEEGDLDSARNHLSMIVKRDTKNLDKNHILSGVLESVSENTVDGVTGPLFYYAIFGLPGAFVYRAINTIDSMVGYKTTLFKNVGWFGAKCDTVLNYAPSRLTGLVMILGALILGYNWKESLYIMKRDSRKLESPNAGFPMAALAGALGTRLEKMNYYTIGNGSIEFTKSHIISAITLMKVSSILFCGIVTIPIIVTLSFLGWWIHA